ncbi:MAG TPA: hypothetical protein VF159_03260, partial [Gemmatimonadaceae bacterium]
MRPRIPPAPPQYDQRDQNELRRQLEAFMSTNADVQPDPIEVMAPRISRIKQSVGSPPDTATDLTLVVENGGNVAGTLSVWVNKASPNDADPSGEPDGTIALTALPATVGPTSVFELTGGGTDTLFDDIRVHPGRGKNIYVEFVDGFGATTGVVKIVLTSRGGIVDENNEMVDGAIDSRTKFAAGITPVEIVDEFPTEGNFVGRTIVLTTDGKLYRWDGEQWTAAVPAGDITGQINSAQIADEAINTAKFAAGLTPVEIVDELPAPGNQGRVVFLTTDSKLYRDTGSAWTAAVPATDVTGQISGSQIANAAISTAKFAAGLRPVEVVSALPAPGTAGRVVFLTSDNKLYRDTGSAWTAAVPAVDVTGELASAQIADLAVEASKLADGAVVAAKIAAGAVTAQKLAAQAVSAEKLFVGSFDNLIPDPGFEQGDLANWYHESAFSLDTSHARSGTRCLKYDPALHTSGSQNAFSGPTPSVQAGHVAVSSGDQLYAEVWARTLAGGAHRAVQLQIQWRAADGSFISNSAVSTSALTSSYSRISVSGTAPAGAAWAALGVTINTLGASDTVFFDDFYMRRKVTGSIIVDGEITTAKLAANAVTSNELAANAVTAGKVQAGAITTDKLAARSVSLLNLFVGSYDNLILDPGFEGTTALADGETGWTRLGMSESGGVQSIVTTNTRSGLRAVKFDPAGQTATWQLGANGRQNSGAQHPAATAGDQFYFEAYVRKVGTGTPPAARVVIVYRGGDGGFLSQSTGSPLIPTQSYQKISVSGTAPAGTASVQFRLQADLTAGATEPILFDDAYARRMVTGSIIVDGEITAAKIAANTITANEIAANAITSSELA